MTAIYKREMRSYLTSPVGYVFLAVFFAISGYYFFATSLVSNTTDMKKIPGIGSGIARLISNYRRQLGGFYCVEQLGEIGLDHHQLAAWFRIDTTALQRLDVNHTGIEQLRRHPYLNFYQAKAIVEYRRKHGPLKSLKPLALYEEFTPDDLERLSHYLSFE